MLRGWHVQKRTTKAALGLALVLAAMYLVAQTRITSAIPDDANLVPHYITDQAADSNLEERFLAYLPHSGLSNQRIELANALLLAFMLNRTLVLPPAFLGNVKGWAKSDILYDHLGWLTNASIDFDTLCQAPHPGNLASYVQRSRCTEYKNFAAIEWTELHDLSTLSPSIRVRQQAVISLSELQRDLGVSDTETYVHQDQQLYDWRLFESKEGGRALMQSGGNYIESFTGRQYYRVYSLDYWQQRPERLLQLGGIFSSSRFSIVSPANLAMKAKIAKTLLPRRDTLLGQIVNSMVEYLGGPGSFLAVHIRVGDPPFRRQLGPNLLAFANSIADLTGAPKPPEDDFLAQLEANATETNSEQSKYIPFEPPKDGLDQPPWSTVCRSVDPVHKTSSHGARTIIYMATDHPSPRGKDSELLPWFEYFPCTVVLSDLPDHLFEPLDGLHDLVNPAKSLRPFLIPLVDGMIAAHGSQVFTTPRSTYSHYIGDMNSAWIR